MYVVTYVDDYSRFVKVYSLKRKSQVVDYLVKY